MLIPWGYYQTEKKNRACNENEPLESGPYYRSLLDHLNEDIMVIDREYKITDVNNPFLTTTGYHRDEVIGISCYEISHGYDKPCDNFGEDCKLQQVFTTGKSTNCIHEHVKQDGSVVWVDILLSPLTDRNGKITHAIESAREITGLIEMQKALHESEEKYRRIFDNSVVGFFQSTPQGRFVTVNSAFARMLRYESSEDLVSNVSNISAQYYANPEDRRRYQKILQQEGYVENFEFKAKCKDDAVIWVSNSTRVYYGPDGEVKFYEGIVLDITHRKRSGEGSRAVVIGD